ncbi:hypothetical protein SEPCBS57363_000460 [Sporothrix epigloea]|uniref:Gem-associated protein 5 TPR domain-containing protein n=1 Tax=Sporothrix epigloea TaxID=1892477 RepID=A0ABP0D595_9PEZI
MFLYTNGNAIVCCHHDTLTIERLFSRHTDNVLLLAVDNMSERGAGRLVFSYDASQNAIVWDVLTGNEVARFASASNLTAVAWMRTGAIALGNESGAVILFDPETLEHVSYRTIDQIAVTALAPASDSCTFAIGYQNGSVLVYNLQPKFTVSHNLATSCDPSPIIGLAWHASSVRQKSNMLAVQTYDGDLRVWSVAKAQHNVESAKVVRSLTRPDAPSPGPNWMSWSKNGRIIQFSKGETLSWDVRTKHVTFDIIATHEHVRGLAVYGPGASLFTVGANNTVQQYDLNAPAVMVASVRHPATSLPPSPPMSVEEQRNKAATVASSEYTAFSDFETATSASLAANSESELSTQLDSSMSESDDDYQPPLSRLIYAGQSTVSTRSDLSRTVGATSSASSHISDQTSRSGAGNRSHSRNARSVRSQSAMTEHTLMSTGSSLKLSIQPNKYQQPQVQQQYWTACDRERQFVPPSRTATGTPKSTSEISRRTPRLHRTHNELPQAMNDSNVPDLFKFTRSRLSDVPYQMPPPPRNTHRLTNDDLRRQMLYTIFGWTEDIKELVRDEMNRYPAGSANQILLAKWLGDINPDIITTSSESMTSSDWMLLALSGIGSHASQYKLGRAYMQRLLETGDVHAAATIMIGMGDCNDAIEIYVSHHKYMEALIVAALFFPSVWERQSYLINKWGEWAIQNGRRDLAIRCAACAGMESTEPWTSPSAAQITFPSIHPQRSIAKAPALRLITSFGDADSNIRAQIFHENGGATPLAAGVTPIAVSAIPMGLVGDNDVTTAFLRPSQHSVFNTPSSALPNGRDFSHQRLPYVGEHPQDTLASTGIRRALERGVNVSSMASQSTKSLNDKFQPPTTDFANFPAETSSFPISSSLQQRHKDPSSPVSLTMISDSCNSRNGPRHRIPVEKQLQLVPIKSIATLNSILPEQKDSSNHRYRWPTRRRGPGSVSSSVTSISSATHGTFSDRTRVGDVSDTSDVLDEYISSLEEMNAKVVRLGGTKRHPESNITGQRRPFATILPTHHSPELSATVQEFISDTSATLLPVPIQPHARSYSESRPSSRVSSRSRAVGKHSHESRPFTLEVPRGRNVSRATSSARSPSSPLPYSENGADNQDSDADENGWRALYAHEKLRSQDYPSLHGRSSSHDRLAALPGSVNALDVPSSSIYVPLRKNRAQTGPPPAPSALSLASGIAFESHPPSQHTVREQLDRRQTQSAMANRGDLRELSSNGRAQRKAAAARELEERRMTLVRQALAPSIVHPKNILMERKQALVRKFDVGGQSSDMFINPSNLPTRSQSTEPTGMTGLLAMSSRTRGVFASDSPSNFLATTPKAMRLAETVPREQPSLAAPPRLKELAHLAVLPPPPPPPPPASLSFNHGVKTPPVVYGGHTSGTIEMVMDDGEEESLMEITEQSNIGETESHCSSQSPPSPSIVSVFESQLQFPSRNGHKGGLSNSEISNSSHGPHAPFQKSSERTAISQMPHQQTAYNPHEGTPPLSYPMRDSSHELLTLQQQDLSKRTHTGLRQSDMI